MPLLGSAAILLIFDIAVEAIEEHDRWHTHEHLPERLSIPGFLRGTRWVTVSGAPRYMVLYEVANLQTLASKAYLTRLNNPTPWTRRMMPHYRGMTRGLCAVPASCGDGHGGTAALIRFTPDDSSAPELKRWLAERILPQVPGTSGLGAAHLLEGAQSAAMTNEQRIRGEDRGVHCAVIVTGYGGDAVSTFANGLCAADALPSRGAKEISVAMYDLRYILSASTFSERRPASMG